jgi:predicted ferric reductase
MKARDWVMAALGLLGVLILMGVLDGNFGTQHEYLGNIEFVCPLKGACH